MIELLILAIIQVVVFTVFVTDVTYHNQKDKRLPGIRKGEMTGALWCHLAGPDHREALQQVLKMRRTHISSGRILELEQRTGLVAPLPAWRTVDVGRTKMHYAIRMMHGPDELPFDGGVMRAQYQPADERLTSSPLGHEGHLFLGVHVTGCNSCIRQWAREQHIRQTRDKLRDMQKAHAYLCQRWADEEKYAKRSGYYHMIDYDLLSKKDQAGRRIKELDKELKELVG